MVDVLAGSTPGRGRVDVAEVRDGESVAAHVRRVEGGTLDLVRYARILGAANEFKHGDEAIGVAAADDQSRARARRLLAATTVGELHATPVFEDAVSRTVDGSLDHDAKERAERLTLRELCEFVLTRDQHEVDALARGLHSDVIGALVKLMSNDELTELGKRLFHPLPGSRVGAEGYMGARIQPNSPTDHEDDIRWQVFSGFSYAVGDVLLGTNPVDSTPGSVAKVEAALLDIVETFGLTDVLPHCVLSHIDVQAEAERRHPGTTGVWFQSLAGTESANRTFDLTVDKMLAHARSRTGKYGLYLETGQGADFTNGHGHGFDMVLHEARKYGFARALKQAIAAARGDDDVWLHLNDVAGFIGPEVFESREQLVRVCLEDIAMGKLHGLTIGLDICSTLHMKVTLDDLTWCIDRILPANPAYLMALPTRNDPMLSYLTTSFQDHVRIRERFGYRVDDRMWAFFQRLGVIDADGRPTGHFGDPVHVYERYLCARGDDRASDEMRAEGTRLVAEVEARGVPIASGRGAEAWDLRPDLDARIRGLYEDAKRCVFAELPDDFAASIDGAVELRTGAVDRHDYLLEPIHGEEPDADAAIELARLRASFDGVAPDVVVVLSDGLNPHALTDDGHLAPFLDTFDQELTARGIARETSRLVFRGGRVRVGYRVGEALFGGSPDDAVRAVVHVIGERPGSGHRTYSVYVAAATGVEWSEAGTVDHDRTRVVSGIADTALRPELAARQAAAFLTSMGIGA